MKPKHIKRLLESEIKSIADNPHDYCNNPDTDFTRTRKLPLMTILKGIIGMESGNLTNELVDLFDASVEMPTASAFVQQRSKLKPEAFETIFKNFSEKITESSNDMQMPVLAVDGSKIQIATDASDIDSYFPGTNGQKPYNLLHLNVLFDLKQRVYLDAMIQKSKYANEHKAFIDMVDRSKMPKALVIADRGYESYNNLAHIQEKGWYYLIRIKDGINGMKNGFDLPDETTFDMDIQLNLTRKQTNEVKELLQDKNHFKLVTSTTTFDYLPKKNRKNDPTKFYEISFRIVRFQISEDAYETVITNLKKEHYPLEKL